MGLQGVTRASRECSVYGTEQDILLTPTNMLHRASEG